jgi:hypothetical protein
VGSLVALIWIIAFNVGYAKMVPFINRISLPDYSSRSTEIPEGVGVALWAMLFDREPGTLALCRTWRY